MRVAFVSYLFPPLTIGGCSMYAYKLTKELASLGHKVDIEVPSKGRPLSVSPPHEELSRQKKGNFFTFCLWARNIIEYDRYDIIHCNAGPGAFLKRCDVETLFHIEPLSLSTAYFSNLINIYAAYRSRAVITDSELGIRDMVKSGIKRDKIFVTYLGVDVNEFYPTQKVHDEQPKTLTMLSVGHLIPRKRPFLALRCLRAALREFPCRLIYVGKGPLHSRLIREAEKLGILENVEFVVPRMDARFLRELYNMADVLVHPSSLEGFGMVLAESVACSTPFVAMNTGIAPLLAKDGFGYACRTDDEFIKKCLDLLKRPMKMGWKGYKYIKEKFSWRHTAERTLRVYERILSSR